MKLILISLLTFIGTSCSSLNSGKYVKLNSSGDLEKIAKEYNVSEKKLRRYNADISPGKWIFVPFKAGILSSGDNTYPAGYFYSKGDFLWPLRNRYKISSHFGKRGWRKHHGIDLTAPKGTEILAAKEGKVIFSGWMRGYGRVVILKHDKKFHTVYAHTSKNLVSKGEFVQKGQKIAKVGSTGRSTGNHLHFEIRVKDKAVDPLAYYETSRLANN